MKRLLVPIVLVGLLTTVATSAQNSAARIDAAFEKFWAASSPEEAARVTQEVLRSGVTFDDAFGRLKAGRRYTPQASGIIKLMNKTRDGVEHHYAVNVPENYSPSRKYQVRFQLHGGVDGRTDNQPRGSGAIGQLAGAEQIYVLPYSWRDAPWWSDDQILNLNAIVDQLKRTYNIDENRVVVAGVSDGGTGAYYVAMRETTPFASFLPLNGFILVLANNDIDDGRNYPNNLRNKPLFVINGGRDRLYPTSAVEPFTRHLMSSGVTIEYHPHPEGEHNTAWWPQEKDGFEKFVTDHPRNPYPDTLTWTTSDTTHNRAHWLVIDEFGQRPSSTRSLPNVNLAPGGELLFENEKPAGRVDISRKDNTFEALTTGVASFTILLSPDRVDFSRPVKVIVNGRTVFDSRVQRNAETLLKWASRDNDRTMLFGAELEIRVP
jgi:acetyl esterase/lipase